MVTITQNPPREALEGPVDGPVTITGTPVRVRPDLARRGAYSLPPVTELLDHYETADLLTVLPDLSDGACRRLDQPCPCIAAEKARVKKAGWNAVERPCPGWGFHPPAITPPYMKPNSDVYAYPRQSDVVDGERALCAACPVQDLCRRYALGSDVRGVWAGTTYAERVVWRKDRGVLVEPLSVVLQALIDRAPNRSSSDDEESPTSYGETPSGSHSRADAPLGGEARA